MIRYTIEELEPVLKPERAAAVNGESFKIPETVRPGDRHDILYKFLRSQKARGISFNVALISCHALNKEQCKPPLPDGEVESHLKRAWDQPDSPTFQQPKASSAIPFPEESKPTSIEDPKQSAIVVRKASDVPDEKLEKTFGGRLVRGSIALVSGPGEGGKGMFAVDCLARFTTGEPFPGEDLSRVPANVIVCVTEDSMGRVKSRLHAAGADLDRVYFIEGPTLSRGGLSMPSPMMLDDDAGAVVDRAKDLRAQALFLETVVEHFGDREGKKRRSTNNEADVRAALSPFRSVCQAANLFGFGAIHPRKSMDGSIYDSISGSAAFRNVSRAAHHIYRDPADESDDPGRLFFTSKASYLSRRPVTLKFSIRAWDDERRIPCNCNPDECPHEGRVIWDSDVEDSRTAEDIWQELAERNRPRRDVAVKDAEEFLLGLADKDMAINLLPKEIFNRASDEGISKSSVNRAKEKLKFVSVKHGFPAEVSGWKVSK